MSHFSYSKPVELIYHVSFAFTLEYATKGLYIFSAHISNILGLAAVGHITMHKISL